MLGEGEKVRKLRKVLPLFSANPSRGNRGGEETDGFFVVALVWEGGGAIGFAAIG